MSKASSDIYQLPNGMWDFRYAFWIDDKQNDIKRTTDEKEIRSRPRGQQSKREKRL